MPIYEYRCERCGHELDALQKMNDAPLTDCPSCDAPRLVKLVSAPSFRLKGAGWYETDFKKDKQRNLAGDKEPKKKKDDKKSDSSKETKTTDTKKDKSKAASKDTGGKSASASE